MKLKPTSLTKNHLAVLRLHLQNGARMGLLPALALGRRAGGLGVDTLELVRIHKRALAVRESSKVINGQLERAEELAATHRELKRGLVRRKVMELAAEKCGAHHKKCLQESLQLQNHLRQLTRRVLALQEDERTSISHELQAEIVQTLLGINVRLLSLKQQARNQSQGLKIEIASTQRLVANSARSVRRVARKFGNS